MSWNYRVVRRYGPEAEPYLVVTEVFYRKGAPHAFSLGESVGGFDDEAEAPADYSDARALASLHTTLERMALALDKPILDEQQDFSA